MQAIFGNQILFFGLIIVEFGLVLGISAAINRLSAGTASGLFLLYSALNGVTLAAIFAVYAKAVIINAGIQSVIAEMPWMSETVTASFSASGETL